MKNPKEEAKTHLEKLLFPELVKELAEYYKNIPLLEKRKEEPEQETLEDAAEECFKEKEILGYTYEIRDGFILGAKWQKEQDKNLYSEQEVLKIIDLLFHRHASSFRIDAKEDFLQWKKK